MFLNPTTGKLNISALRNELPGDFPHSPRAYSAPQKEPAEQYAKFAKRCLSINDIAIVQVAVPSTLIEGLSVQNITSHAGHSGDAWRKLVWYSRRREVPARELDHIAGKQLLTANLASGIETRYTPTPEAGGIEPHNVLFVTIQGQKKRALQWVFQREAEREFDEQYEGEAWVIQFCKTTGL